MPALHRRVASAPPRNPRWIAAGFGGAAGLLLAFAPAVGPGSRAGQVRAGAVAARDAASRPPASPCVAAVLVRAPRDSPAAALAPAQERP